MYWPPLYRYICTFTSVWWKEWYTDLLCVSSVNSNSNVNPWQKKCQPLQALTRFSISRKSREEMVHFFLSRAGELNFHFSRCSRMSRFWRKNSRNSRFWKKFSFTSRNNEILQTGSLSLLDSSLNVFSNSREKSYFALWVDFDHQCFAERESILKRQFCVVEQYSDSSVYKSTSWRLLWPRVISGSILNGCPVERAYAKHARMRS